MKIINAVSVSNSRSVGLLILLCLVMSGCEKKKSDAELRITSLPPAEAAAMAKTIEATVTPVIADGLTLKLFGVDSLVADPIAIDIDDNGKIYYVRTNRQKNSEFDIRNHKDWETESIHLQTVEDKRAFLHRVLAPENSKKNEWLADVNGDGSHDWKDMTVERENVYRLEDTDGDGVADKSQLVVDDFHDETTDVAGGVLVDGDNLFVAVGPDLWRMKDTNNDGIADDKKSLSHGYGVHIGFGGHGMSGVEMGPDGRIYWQIGDIGFNGEGTGENKYDHPNSGVVVRSNPDGSDFEVFAYGVRNTHEFVFDEYGNLISEDNDGDHAGEEERLVYIVDGSDTGWRTNWQFGKYTDPDNNTYKVWMDEKMYKPRFEGQAAYITPTIANFVSGPTGMLYNPGTALNEKWKNTFFIVEFVGNPTKSGIHSFKLKPAGASFALGEHKSILSGVLATGIDFGPDGAMYVADWLDGWETKNHGRIWKLDVTDGADRAERKDTQKLLAADLSSYDDEKAGELLKHADMRVRMKAQFELVKRGKKGLDIFEKSISQTTHQLARVHGIWGIAQLARQEEAHAELLLPLLNDSDGEIRAQAARWLGDLRYAKAGNPIIPLLKDENSRVRFFAAEALGRMAYEPATTPLIEMLRANNDEDAYLRHAGSLALARIDKVDVLEKCVSDPSMGVRLAAVVALRRMRHVSVALFLNDADQRVVTEAARAINDDLSIEGALPMLANVLKTTRFSNEPLIRRAINACLRAGTPEAMQNLLAYAAAKNNPLPLRLEAIDALSTWTKPSVLDRVDGRYRGEIKRDGAPVRAIVTAPLEALLSSNEAAMRLSAVKALGKLSVSDASPQLFARLQTDKDPAVRAAALRSLAELNDAKIDVAITRALSDPEKTVRVAGLDLVGKTNLTTELKVKLLNDVIANRTTAEKQAALITLGSLPVAGTAKAFDALLTRMDKNQLPHDIYLELAEAIDSTHADDLRKRYAAIRAKSSGDSLTIAYAASLQGGDAQQGSNIFFYNQTAQCMRCHSFNDYGGNAGPRLNGVASRISREQILEALINPGARLAPGFGTVTLELKKGGTVKGILQKEDARSFVIKSGERPDSVVLKSDVAKRINGQSSMPPMRYLLTQREIRDLVSFLSTLKDEH